jgi:hypothetical protein
MTIEQLRHSGYKVKVLHNRLYNGVYIWQNRVKQIDGPIDPDAKGGSTMVIIDSPDGQHFEGVAICSKKENYNKRMGVKIALGRALYGSGSNTA